jgi:allantoinase
MKLDLIVKNVRVVRPNKTFVDLLDLGIKDGKFVKIAPEIADSEALEVFDGKNLLCFPGLVDAHMHTGIYAPLGEDAYWAVLSQQNWTLQRIFPRSFIGFRR